MAAMYIVPGERQEGDGALGTRVKRKKCRDKSTRIFPVRCVCARLAVCFFTMAMTTTAGVAAVCVRRGGGARANAWSEEEEEEEEE